MLAACAHSARDRRQARAREDRSSPCRVCAPGEASHHQMCHASLAPLARRRALEVSRAAACSPQGLARAQ
eukprot:3745121-Prymnesium_polylepis.1